ncbi:hypothetical protein [Sphingomonas asaccharolytica]|uniref:hypothetical protein n=1 Tax=Sphingomonas asaccharolytica TaxID=40681 RepID=UPI0008364952|nr:hypothetical protein [Sphingomonas asaccharolytica]
MQIKVPESLRPVWDLVVHIVIGAIMLGGILVVELLLAGFIKLIGMAPFAPTWFPAASEVTERGLFAFDVLIGFLFLLTELIKFGKSSWREVRDG